MMNGIREFFDTTAGKITAGLLLVVALGLLGWSVWSNLGEEDIVANTRNRTFMDATTGEPFQAELKVGWKVPIPAPSGGNTGYPAEMCGWTADGKPTDDLTPVLLNQYVDKKGPTFCPVCHRLVRERNPIPNPNGTHETAPPTEQEWNKMSPKEKSAATSGQKQQ